MNIIKQPYDFNRQGEREIRHREYNIVYNTPEGKRVIDDILHFAGMSRSAFCGKSHYQTNFNLGRQSIGYHVVAAITIPPQQPQQQKDENYE